MNKRLTHKSTLGPWGFVPTHQQNQAFKIVSAARRDLTIGYASFVTPSREGVFHGNALGNARKIAAAPEMHDCLVDLLALVRLHMPDERFNEFSATTNAAAVLEKVNKGLSLS